MPGGLEAQTVLLTLADDYFIKWQFYLNKAHITRLLRHLEKHWKNACVHVHAVL